MPSLLSLRLPFSTCNLLLSFYVPVIFCFFTFAEKHHGKMSNCICLFQSSHKHNSNCPLNQCATDLFNISFHMQTDWTPAQPGPPAVVSPRQGVLAWLYPSEQQPGLSPAHQIDSVCVITRVANANTVHLLILIHLPLVEVQAQTHMHVYVWQKHSSEGIHHILSNRAQYCKCDSLIPSLLL